MPADDLPFIRNFFRAVTDRPLGLRKEDASLYVPFYEKDPFSQHDPVKLLARPIEFSMGQSVQLFSGYRGSGKSTELRRLQQHLSKQGYKVVLCDIEDYLNPSQPVDISDFLIALAGAFGEKLVEAGHLTEDPAHEGYWTRLTNFLVQTDVTVTEASVTVPLPAATPNVKAALKSDPSFRQRLQSRMSGHLGELVQQVRTYIEECVKRVKARFDDNTEVVLLLDSMEHIVGTSINATQVQNSVVNLFATHAEKLHFDFLHVVYTMPPYLKVLQANLGTLYAPGGVQVLPTLKVRDISGQPYSLGIDLMEQVISKRGNWQRLLGPDRTVLDRISELSGGHLRDFLRLFSEILRRADSLPVPASTVEAAIAQVRSEFLPIADADTEWLDVIARTHETALKDHSKLHDLARFLDTHLALYYRNGADWYDVHPLVRDIVVKQADGIRGRADSRK